MFGLTSLEFVLTLPIFVFLFYILPKQIRQYYLLVFNLVFYISFGYKTIVVLLLEAGVAYIAAMIIDGISSSKRKCFFIASIVLLSSILLFFKLGININSSIVLPLGLSFYTLQAISYIVDVYNKIICAEKNPFKILIFLSFFPTITSGPIYRYKFFLQGYKLGINELRINYNRIINGIVYIVYGYFMKLVVAERAAIPVNYVFSEFNYGEYGGSVLFIIAVTYSIQIYSDFAGYSAIVIGIAQLIGFDIPENFLAPYLSMSIKEFWSRWHISLSSWLRDYIYIPLGGNRKGKIRKYINILITFLVSGLWHGTGIHFIIWGGVHGFYQIVSELFSPFRKRVISALGIVEESTFHKLIKRIITFIMVTMAWIPFRTGAKDSFLFIKEMIIEPHLGYLIWGKLWTLGLMPFDWILLYTCVLIMLYVDNLVFKGTRIDKALQSQGYLARSLVIIIMVLSILIMGIYGGQHDASYFVYRDF